MHKLKTQWLVLGLMGAVAMTLGTADIPLVSAGEVDAVVTQTLNSMEGQENGWIDEAALQENSYGIATKFGSAYQSGPTEIQMTAQISYASYENGASPEALFNQIYAYLESASGHRLNLVVSQTDDPLLFNLSFNEKALNPDEKYQVIIEVDGSSDPLWTDQAISQNTILGKLSSSEQHVFYTRDGTQISQLTLKHLLQTSLEPLGSTLYVWGGGWNEADDGAGVGAVTMGVSDRWETFFLEYGRRGYNYKKTMYQINDGLDCSGYIGWTIYNTVNSANNKDGYVMFADQMAKNFADRGWGTYTNRSQISGYKPGDVMSSSGHVYMVLGTASDGSLVIIHASPQGVQINGTPTPSGKPNSKAVQLATQYMSTYYPEWYDKFPNTKVGSFYLTQFDEMSWDVSGNELLSDPDGITDMSAEEVLATLFSR